MELNPISKKESGSEHYQKQDSSSRPSGTKLHNEDNTIVLDSEEEPLEEDDDGSMELNPVSEKESYNKQDSSNTANNNEEGDNSINRNELGGTIINATLQFSTCNEPEIYSESDIQNAFT